MAKGQTIAMKCEACRREGTKLFLKGTRCESPKCAFHRRDYPPGQHPFRRGKISEYGVRVREKQRCKRTFGMRERPFRRLFALAERQTGNTGENLFRLLERRLDNVLFRMGMALSRRHARQAIAHGLIFVNGHKLDRASYLVEIERHHHAAPQGKGRQPVQGDQGINERPSRAVLARRAARAAGRQSDRPAEG